MNRVTRYIFYVVMWTLVALYVVWASSAARSVRQELKIKEWKVELLDSTSQGQLVSTADVYRWLTEAKLAQPGSAADSLDLTAVEQLVARNGFVDRVAACLTADGTLRIAINQREPVLRLLTDGDNAYVTASGFVFATPRSSSLYVPVVTGGYRPPFPAGYTGDVRVCIDERLRKIQTEIDSIDRCKVTVYQAERAGQRQLRDSLRKTIKWWRKWVESDADYQAMVKRLKDQKTAWRRLHRYRARLRAAELDRLDARRMQASLRQKKLEKSYEDFMKLLTFVKQVERNDFWGAEVVQIVARTAPSGSLEVDLVPRSGRHLIRFGRLEREEEKLDLLMRFYQHTLPQVGWDRYRTIDLRYAGQIICR